MKPAKRPPLLLVALLALVVAGCSPRALISRELADALASQGSGPEDDPELVRDAAPFHLKLSESVLRDQPEHRALAESVAAGFTRYAWAFVAFEADRIEAENLDQAIRLRDRAARLYARAQRHALTALELAHPGLRQALNSPNAQDWPRLPADQAGLAYWGAAAWGGWISLSKDKPEVVADLPLAFRLARLAAQADPDWQHGAPLSLLGTFESSRPGGDRQQALSWFDEALARADGHPVGALLAKAEGYALPEGDRALFDALLQQILNTPDAADGSDTLENRLIRQRARWLQTQADELF